MNQNCLNCGEPLKGHFCHNCGQKATVGKLAWKSLLEEIFHFITHVEKGFFKTGKLLILKPGQLYKSYLAGKRKDYHKPISFLLIWIAVFILIFSLSERFTNYQSENTSTFLTNDSNTSALISKYRSLIEIMILPFTALISWLIVGRHKLNYVEILAVTFYSISFLFILLSVQFIIALVLGINFKTNNFDIATIGIFLCWGIYCGYDFFKQYRISWLIPRLLLSLFLNAIVYIYLEKLIVKVFVYFHL